MCNIVLERLVKAEKGVAYFGGHSSGISVMLVSLFSHQPMSVRLSYMPIAIE